MVQELGPRTEPRPESWAKPHPPYFYRQGLLCRGSILALLLCMYTEYSVLCHFTLVIKALITFAGEERRGEDKIGEGATAETRNNPQGKYSVCYVHGILLRNSRAHLALLRFVTFRVC